MLHQLMQAVLFIFVLMPTAQGNISHQSFSLVDWLRKQHPSSHSVLCVHPTTSPSHL